MKRKHHVNPGLRYGWLSGALLLAVAAVLLLVNIAAERLENKYALRVDCSFNAAASYGEATQKVLSELKHPVHIYALFPKGEENLQLIELLNKYQAHSDLVTWEMASLSLNPGLSAKFSGQTAAEESVSSDSVIVYCQDTDRWRILSPLDLIQVSYDTETGIYRPANLVYESKLTSAILYVTQDRIPKVSILQGHGELQKEELGLLEELLGLNHFEVRYLTLSDGQQLPEDELLMILSPVRDLRQGELDSIRSFCDAGGRLFFTCDYSDPVENMPNWQALLRSYGFLPQNGVVVADAADKNTYYSSYPVFLIPEMQSTDATIDLLSAHADTLLLPGSRGFSIPEEEDRNLMTRTVLSSADSAYLKELDSFSLEAMDYREGDRKGPFALALQATRVTGEGEISKAFILGCSTLITEEQVQAVCDAQEFLLTMIRYLADEEPIDPDIMPKAAVRPQLSARSLTAGTFALVLLPLLAAAAALLVLPRRSR